MSLTEQINNDIKAAMLAKNEASLRALRAIKSALLLAKTEKSANAELTEDEERKLLQKLVKQRKESMDIYISQNREDLAKNEQEEIEVIEKYLPQQMSGEEIRKELRAIIESVGAKTQADLGKVMGVASKHFAGRADNKQVSAMIREMLG
jgi:uncharacterized protein